MKTSTKIIISSLTIVLLTGCGGGNSSTSDQKDEITIEEKGKNIEFKTVDQELSGNKTPTTQTVDKELSDKNNIQIKTVDEEISQDRVPDVKTVDEELAIKDLEDSNLSTSP